MTRRLFAQVLDDVTCGDCIDVMAHMPRACVDFILTDPPYLVRYRDRQGRTVAGDADPSWLGPAFAQMYRVLRDDSLCVSFYGWNHADRFLTAARSAGFRPAGHIVFRKPYASGARFLRYEHEQAFLFTKGRPPRPANPPPDVLDGWTRACHRHRTGSVVPRCIAYSLTGCVLPLASAVQHATTEGLMPKETYTASKTRSNRPGWSISFRHPLRRDTRGRLGLKMRRGLGTADEAEAESMVTEMNTILADSSWWNAAKRREAELRFSKPVVDAFYDDIQAGKDDPESLRESDIPMPSSEDGYARVLFVGTTGAGKTSLLRQLIGSDPEADRFPSTAPAKTTIADIEVIQAQGPYEAAVTFFSEFHTQANIEECVVSAALAVMEDSPTEKVAERFLNHRDQKFRLSYILGGWQKDGGEASDDDMFFDVAETAPGSNASEEVSDEDRTANRRRIASYLDRIAALSHSIVGAIADDLGVDLKASGPDRDAALELIEEEFDTRIAEDEAFHDLVQDILEDVRSRFDAITVGDLDRARSGWPQLWRFTSDDRGDFLRQIRWFSSNTWTEFGRLLTPLVDGMRVRGPLIAPYIDTDPKLVLIDGQGLGHTPDSSASVSTHVTRRFAQADVILVVDNAKQPMQAAPLSVLRAVASSGHHDRLAIAFTHFDQIRGQNLPSFPEKRAHVMASVLNALSGLREVLGPAVVKVIEQGLEARCFMLGGVDRPFDKLPKRAADYMRDQISRMVDLFGDAILPPPTPEARPFYDPSGIGFAVQEAVSRFQGPWLARLGIRAYEGYSKEHWSRVKALNRRIAGELDTEYDTLRPVADLVTHLRESVSRFLNRPQRWTSPPGDEQEEQAIIAQIRQTVDAALHDLAVKRLVEAHLSEWRVAYDDFRGPGSTRLRAAAIHDIYDAAAPLPDAVMTSPSSAFLAEIRRIVVSAIAASGGQVSLSDAAPEGVAAASVG